MGTRFGAPRVRFDWRSFITPAVKILVLTCAGVFLAQSMIEIFRPASATSWFNHWFGLVPSGVIPGFRLWQPVTYLFLHGNLWHLLINMLMLWMFGRELELVWGKKRFLDYFFLCGIGAGLITILVKFIPLFWGHRPSDIPTIGASGAIFGILIANAILFPDRQIWLFPLPIMIPMRPFVGVMAAIEFFSTLGSGGDNAAARTSRDRLNVQRIDRHGRISASPGQGEETRRARGGPGERPCRHCIAEGNA